jgi:hypothetical protein
MHVDVCPLLLIAIGVGIVLVGVILVLGIWILGKWDDVYD